MQPLDRTVFKGLMAFYNRAADQWMTMHPGKRICIYQMARLFTKIYNKVASVERGVEGFWASGLWPLEKDIFTEADFMVTEVIEEPEPIAKSIEPQCSTAATDAATSSTTATSTATITSSTYTTTSSNAETSTSATSTSATTSTVQPTLAPNLQQFYWSCGRGSRRRGRGRGRQSLQLY
ncbi:uncharacterized protein LOC110523915 isoform X2 [Oncorhynchus mykiss]|uniref:uncharacterized protein LOC110523915 isoform X2 n=1 Tax=Oncorhynchus mykiss TaxID=8022 RepID=UPI001877C385|nr:uncharacterized protein LOC110523915 isoform X2 [Oncorhynchus mykiss]